MGRLLRRMIQAQTGHATAEITDRLANTAGIHQSSSGL
jgi:hypothetical protein